MTKQRQFKASKLCGTARAGFSKCFYDLLWVKEAQAPKSSSVIDVKSTLSSIMALQTRQTSTGFQGGQALYFEHDLTCLHREKGSNHHPRDVHYTYRGTLTQQ